MYASVGERVKFLVLEMQVETVQILRQCGGEH